MTPVTLTNNVLKSQICFFISQPLIHIKFNFFADIYESYLFGTFIAQ
jgi:hypothetical protein